MKFWDMFFNQEILQQINNTLNLEQFVSYL